MEEKIKFVEEYIAKLQKAIDSNDSKAADRLQDEVIAIFDSEIDNIRGLLDNYSYAHMNGTAVDFLGDAEILKGKLINYKLNLQSGLCFSQNNQGGVNVTQQVTQQVQNDIRLSFEQVVLQIQEMPKKNLSDEEKDILCGKLTAIEMSKDKKSRWEKVQDTLKWIAEKGIEVGVAALPYIAKALEGGGA